MALIDCHVHSAYSPDGNASIADIVAKAVDMGVKHINITDHCDLKHPEGFIGVDENCIEEYVEEIERLKFRLRNKIYVGAGLEVGFNPKAESETAKLLKNSGVEYVINSIHVVGGSDCYDSNHFDGKTKASAYNDYLDAVLASLKVSYPFDAIGHLGYIERIAPFSDKRMRFSEFQEKIIDIFDILVEKGIILELNTSIGGAFPPTLPSIELLKQYKDRGGHMVTISSDSHDLNHICRNFDEVIPLIKEAGFPYLTAIEHGDRVQYKI